MPDYAIVETPDGAVLCHRPTCPAVDLARLSQWPILNLYDCAKPISEIIGEYEAERNPTHFNTPRLHTCLEEEHMSNTDGTILCPRCEQRNFTPYGRSAVPQGSGISEFAAPPALSRTDNASYICSECGTDEAMRDFSGQPPIPPTDWPIRYGFGVGSHTPKPVDE